jgi:hypothetical protein
MVLCFSVSWYVVADYRVSLTQRLHCICWHHASVTAAAAAAAAAAVALQSDGGDNSGGPLPVLLVVVMAEKINPDIFELVGLYKTGQVRCCAFDVCFCNTQHAAVNKGCQRQALLKKARQAALYVG